MLQSVFLAEMSRPRQGQINTESMIWPQLIFRHESELHSGQIEDIGVSLRLDFHNRWKKKVFKNGKGEKLKTNEKLANC